MVHCLLSVWYGEYQSCNEDSSKIFWRALSRIYYSGGELGNESVIEGGAMKPGITKDLFYPNSSKNLRCNSGEYQAEGGRQGHLNLGSLFPA